MTRAAYAEAGEAGRFLRSRKIGRRVFGKRNAAAVIRRTLGDMLRVSCLLLSICCLRMAVMEKRSGELQFICGMKPVYIVSGSMEPTIMTGAVILIEEADEAGRIQPGDIITFRGRGGYVTHRLIGEDAEAKAEQKPYLITKGDHNRVEDFERLSAEDVVGKVVLIWNFPAKLKNALKAETARMRSG